MTHETPLCFSDLDMRSRNALQALLQAVDKPPTDMSPTALVQRLCSHFECEPHELEARLRSMASGSSLGNFGTKTLHILCDFLGLPVHDAHTCRCRVCGRFYGIPVRNVRKKESRSP
jgi:hypothetical protein